MTTPDRYSCEEAFHRLEGYLDRALSAEEMRMVREHLETCAVCAREFGYEASVLQEIRRKLDHIDLPPDLIERIARKLREADPGA
jgi:anti-sigma factor (TIGR02949 family)